MISPCLAQPPGPSHPRGRRREKDISALKVDNAPVQGPRSCRIGTIPLNANRPNQTAAAEDPGGNRGFRGILANRTGFLQVWGEKKESRLHEVSTRWHLRKCSRMIEKIILNMNSADAASPRVYGSRGDVSEFKTLRMGMGI